MAIPFQRTSFASGEITPSLFGHVDLARYAVGCSTLRNCFVSYRGGAYSRQGTLFVGFSKQTGRAYPPRLITFQFSINQGLILEFGNLYMRVISDGAFVTEAATNISGVTQASPAVVTDTGHGYSTGDWVYIASVGGMTQLNGRTFVITKLSNNSYSLQDVYGNNINSTGYTAYTSGGTASRIYTLVTPYAEADLEYLKWTQSADVMSLCCWNQITGTDYLLNDLERFADDDWVLNAVNPQPTIAAPASASASPSAVGTTDFQYVATAVNPADGSESIASPIGDSPNSIDIGSTLGSITVTYAAVATASKYNIYKATPVYNGTVPSGAQFGYAGTAYGTQWVDQNVTPDFTQVPPTHINPFAPGQIESVTVTAGGSGITTLTFAITTSTGSGFAGYPVIQGGVLVAFVVTDSGEGYQPGDSIAFNGAGFASGTITFSINPTNGDTITLNGIVWTFVSGSPSTAQTQIKGSLALTLTQLAADLSASVNPALTVAGYYVSATVLTVQYKTAGAGGDAYTLAASAATRSGPTLTGGTGSGSASGVLVIGPESGTYPSTAAYFQERRVYASSPNNPDTYWMSQPGTFTNFDVRNPTIASDAITGSPWSVEVNGIQFMVSMPGGLVVLTGLSAWQLTGVGGSSLNPQPITPANQQAQPQAYNGCSATVPPIRIDNEILYVQAKGSIVRDLSYNFFVNIYTGTDITIISSQLFTGYTIREWAYAEEPFKVVWGVRSDGVMLSCTYLKPQDVCGWARHDTNGLFQSVASASEQVSLQPAAGMTFIDAVYTAVERYLPNGTAYTVERLDDRVWQEAEDCWCVDAGLSNIQTEPNATLSTTAPLGSIVGVTNLVGGSNYSPSTTAQVIDSTGFFGGTGIGPGTGAVPALTIGRGGIITAITFPVGAQGKGYIQPSLQFNDPTGAGAGASAAPVLNNIATFTASAGVFSSGEVGQVIRMGGGIAMISTFADNEHVNAVISQPIVEIIPNSGSLPAPQKSGNWTLTAPITTVTGLYHLVGMTVTGLADGQVIPPTVVSANGTITLATPASNIIIGLAFQAQLQSVYADGGSPTIQGQRKKVAAVTIRTENSRGLMTGANQPDGSTQSPAQIAPTWTNLDAVPDQGQEIPLPPYGNLSGKFVTPCVPLYSSDVRVPLDGGYSKPGQVAVQQSLPLPMQILGLIPEILGADNPETQAHREPANGNGSRRAA